MKTTVKTAGRAGVRKIIFQHDAQDAKFFKTHKFDLFPGAGVGRSTRVRVVARSGKHKETGDFMAAPRVMLGLPTDAQVSLLNPPMRKGGTLHVDMRRDQLRIRRSTISMLEPRDLTMPEAPPWCAEPGQARCTHNDEFNALFARWHAGDEGALDEILWRTEPLLQGALARGRGRVLDPAELESRLRFGMLRASKSYRPGGKHWITYCKTALTMPGCRRFPKNRTLSLDQLLDDSEIEAIPDSMRTEPAEINSDLGDVLEKYLVRLPQNDAKAVRDFYFCGLSKQDIGTAAGKTRQAASVSVLRALKTLRGMLEADGLELQSLI